MVDGINEMGIGIFEGIVPSALTYEISRKIWEEKGENV